MSKKVFFGNFGIFLGIFEKMKRPTFKYEKKLAAEGHFVIGVDEAGCGCLAGPVVAAVVHLPLNCRIARLADSKLLSARQREEIFEEIIARGIPFTVCAVSTRKIDKINIRRATLLAMRRAVTKFSLATFVLVDAWKIPDLQIPQYGIIHGDRLVKSIAAASVVAKVVRDKLMEKFDKSSDINFGGGKYLFTKHKGYGTELHRSLIQRYGPCALHRRSFLKNLV